MNERESVDVESAYGSDVSSNSNFLMRKETFSLEEPTSKKQVWYKWLKQRTREFTIFEGVFSIALLFLLVNSCRLSSQIQETQAMILNLQSQFNTFQKQVTGKDLADFKNQNDQINEESNEELKEMIKDALKQVKTETIGQIETRQSPTIVGTANNSNITTNSTITTFNAASLISGAYIDTSKSSRSSLNPFFGFDQSKLVLLDRSVTPIGKEWCSDEKEPVLTVKLSEYVRPTAVSYQHSEWNGSIPDNAPMVYDVVGCFDFYCEKWELLFSDCKYNPFKHGEQQCNSSSTSISSPVGKVQFRFRKNQGNVQTLCVGLVRVYAQKEEVPKQKVRTLEDTKTCLDLAHNYHNSPITYKYFDHKECKLLYSKECCTECPECCNECYIRDWNGDLIGSSVAVVLGVVFLVAFLVGLSFLIYIAFKNMSY